MATPQHPMQPIHLVRDEPGAPGVARFRENKIVKHLLDMGTCDLNKLSLMTQQGMFPTDDYVQLMQLIGYSVSGFGDLDCAPPELVSAADEIVEKIIQGEASVTDKPRTFRVNFRIFSHVDIQADSAEEAQAAFEKMSQESLLREMLDEGYDDLEADDPILKPTVLRIG